MKLLAYKTSCNITESDFCQNSSMWSDNETDVDLLQFKYLASSVTRIIKTPQLLPTTVGVFGDWGSGKSSLLKMVQKELTSDPTLLCLSFNGWLFEGFEDAPFTTIDGGPTRPRDVERVITGLAGLWQADRREVAEKLYTNFCTALDSSRGSLTSTTPQLDANYKGLIPLRSGYIPKTLTE